MRPGGLPSINPALGTSMTLLPSLDGLKGKAALDAWRQSCPFTLSSDLPSDVALGRCKTALNRAAGQLIYN